jgi:hypothetical protein
VKAAPGNEYRHPPGCWKQDGDTDFSLPGSSLTGRLPASKKRIFLRTCYIKAEKKYHFTAENENFIFKLYSMILKSRANKEQIKGRTIVKL